MSGFTVRGASFSVEIDSESFRVYYNEPVDLRMYDEGSGGSTTLSNIPILHGEVVSQARSISIDIGKHGQITQAMWKLLLTVLSKVYRQPVSHCIGGKQIAENLIS